MKISLINIRDTLMYIGALIGIFLIGYIRVSFSERQKKSPNVSLTYNEKELRLRKIGIAILVVTLLLAAIPKSMLQ
ncbi:MAG: hypothetical protein J6S49_05485 [Erysipelotrichaceae bacterium]|nr:hypothetical protein [Erysipelotrichaceae bacterium]MBP5280158.1 hypothetical protein [Erysipelotrichaceae bacterium]